MHCTVYIEYPLGSSNPSSQVYITVELSAAAFDDFRVYDKSGDGAQRFPTNV